MTTSAGVRFLVLYDMPEDPVAFDRHYREVHIPLVRDIPGVRRYTISRNAVAVRGEEPYYLVAELEWESHAALQAAFTSPAGQAAADDVTKLVSDGRSRRRTRSRQACPRAGPVRGRRCPTACPRRTRRRSREHRRPDEQADGRGIQAELASEENGQERNGDRVGEAHDSRAGDQQLGQKRCSIGCAHHDAFWWLGRGVQQLGAATLAPWIAQDRCSGAGGPPAPERSPRSQWAFGVRPGVSTTATRAPPPAATAATMKPFVNPVSVSPTRLTTATLDTTAAPMDAPNSWNVLTMPEAMPASWGRPD